MSSAKALEDILMGRKPLPTAGGEARRLIRHVQQDAVKAERAAIVAWLRERAKAKLQNEGADKHNELRNCASLIKWGYHHG